MMLVTLAEARAHLRSDTDADDSDLLLKIEAASEAVMSYLGEGGASAFTDSGGDLYEDSSGVAINVPSRVKNATLITTAYLYNERDGASQGGVDAQGGQRVAAWGYGFTLPRAATMLLYSMRSPVVGR